MTTLNRVFSFSLLSMHKYSLKTSFLWLNDMSSYECTMIYGTIPLMKNSLLIFSVLFVDVSMLNCEYL